MQLVDGSLTMASNQKSSKKKNHSFSFCAFWIAILLFLFFPHLNSVNLLIQQWFSFRIGWVPSQFYYLPLQFKVKSKKIQPNHNLQQMINVSTILWVFIVVVVEFQTSCMRILKCSVFTVHERLCFKNILAAHVSVFLFIYLKTKKNLRTTEKHA